MKDFRIIWKKANISRRKHLRVWKTQDRLQTSRAPRERGRPESPSSDCQVPARERGPAMLPAVCKVPGHVFGPTLVISKLSSRSQKPPDTSSHPSRHSPCVCGSWREAAR